MSLEQIKQSDKVLDTEMNYLKNAFMTWLLHPNDYDRQVQNAVARYNKRVKRIFSN